MEFEVSVFLMVVLATLFGGLVSISLSALLAFRLSRGARSLMVAFAAGVMLSSACLDILPEAAEHFLENDVTSTEVFQEPGTENGNKIQENHEHTHEGAFLNLFATFFAGILGFFVLEHFALWRHAHTEEENEASECEKKGAVKHIHAVVPAVLIGDAFHNFVDGVLIAAAFLTNPILGLTTTFAIMAHEVPQELGDFVVLLHAGFSRAKAFIANAASSLTAVLGGVLGYFFMADTEKFIPYVLAVAAASFIYIALADLIPMLRNEKESEHLQGGENETAASSFCKQFILLFSGAFIMALFIFSMH